MKKQEIQRNETEDVIQRELSAKCDDGFFWVGPDLYLHFVFIDTRFAEVWITRDSFHDSRLASVVLIGDRSERDLFEQLEDETKEEILQVANRYLTRWDETIIREGEGYAFEYGIKK